MTRLKPWVGVLILASACADVESGPSDLSVDLGGATDAAVDNTLAPDTGGSAADGPASEQLVVGDGAPSGWVGQPCAQPTDCPAGAVCLQGGEWVWPGGYCSTSCDQQVKPDSCPAGSHCEELAVTGPDLQVCIKDCETETDCRSGYVCAPIPGSPTGGCIPFS